MVRCSTAAVGEDLVTLFDGCRLLGLPPPRADGGRTDRTDSRPDTLLLAMGGGSYELLMVDGWWVMALVGDSCR